MKIGTDAFLGEYYHRLPQPLCNVYAYPSFDGFSSAQYVADASRVHWYALGDFSFFGNFSTFAGQMIAYGPGGTDGDFFFASESTLVGTAWATHDSNANEVFTQYQIPSNGGGKVPEPVSLLLL